MKKLCSMPAFALALTPLWAGSGGFDFVEVRSHLETTQVGMPLTLTGGARHSAASSLTFSFYASTTADPGELGVLAAVGEATGCNGPAGCYLQVEAPGFSQPTRRYYYLEADDGTQVARSTKILVDHAYLSAQAYAGNSFSCYLPSGTQTFSFLVPRTVVGGSSVDLTGRITGLLTPGILAASSFQWSIIDDGGLGAGLSIQDADRLFAVLQTPPVAEETNVTLALELPDLCGLTEPIHLPTEVRIEPTGIPSADLQLTFNQLPNPAISGDEVRISFVVENRGPFGAHDIRLDIFPLSNLFAVRLPDECDLRFAPGEPPPPAFPHCEWEAIAAGESVSAQLTFVTNQPLAAGFFAAVEGLTRKGQPFDPDVRNNALFVQDILVQEQEIYFAQLADGGNLIRSQIRLANPTGMDSTARLVLRDPMGDPLSIELNGVPADGELEVIVPGSGTRFLETSGVGPVLSGTATVTSDAPLQGTIVYRGNLGLAGLTAGTLLEGNFAAGITQDAMLGTRTSFSIMNLEEEEIELTFELTNATGGFLGSATERIPPVGKLARFVDELDWNPSVPLENFEGLLRVRARVVPTGDLFSARMSAAILLVGPDGLTGIAVSQGPRFQ